MKRIVKWLAIFWAIVILAVLSVPFLVNVNQFRPTLEAELSTALGREVKLGNLRLKLLSGEVAADDLSVAEDPTFGKPAFLRAKSLHVGVELWPFLFSRKLIVTDLTIDQPEIALTQSPTGDWNFSSLGAKSKTAPPPSGAKTPLDLSVKLVKVSDGTLTLGRTIGHWKPLVLEQVNLQLRNFSSASAFPFSLSTKVRGGGAIVLDGTAGPLDPADSAMTPVRATLTVTNLDLARSGIADAAPDLAGLASLTGTSESDGRTMHLQGKLNLEKMKLARHGTPATRPVAFEFAVQHDLRKHSGTLRRGDIHIGAAPARLTGTYAERGESVVLNMKLQGPEMPVQELEALLPAMAIVLPAGASLRGGAATVNLTMEGPADRLVTTGSLAVNNTRVTGFDLPKRMAAIERLAGIRASPDTDIQTFSATLRAAPEGMDVQDIKLLVPSLGDLTGAGSVSPANALDFKMSALVHDTAIPFTVTGASSDPVFRPDMRAIAKEQLKSLIKGDSAKSAAGLLRGLIGSKK
jgi:AsmA protein